MDDAVFKTSASTSSQVVSNVWEHSSRDRGSNGCKAARGYDGLDSPIQRTQLWYGEVIVFHTWCDTIYVAHQVSPSCIHMYFACWGFFGLKWTKYFQENSLCMWEGKYPNLVRIPFAFPLNMPYRIAFFSTTSFYYLDTQLRRKLQDFVASGERKRMHTLMTCLIPRNRSSTV